jgi:hypothetical protein
MSGIRSAILICIVVLGAGLAYLSAQRVVEAKPLLPRILHPSRMQGGWLVEFTVIVQGDAFEDGVHMGKTEFGASDGMLLHMTFGQFSDPEHATAKFEKVLGKAVKIVERGKKLDQSGKVVGERAQVVIAGSKPNETMSAVLWTDGRMFREVESKSLPDILELEKEYK